MHVDFEIAVAAEIAVVANDNTDLITVRKWDWINNLFWWFM